MSQYEKFDYDNVSTDGPEPLPEGLYRLKAAKAEATTFGKGDEAKPGLKIRWSIDQDAHGSPLNPKGTAYDNIPATQAALWKVLQLSEAAGIEPLGGNSPGDLQDFAREIMTAGYVAARVEVNEYNGKRSNRVKRYVMGDDAAAAE